MKSQLKKFAALFLSVCVALSIMTVASFATTGSTSYYEKVTTAPDDWSGDYLIVYEATGRVFNGGLASIDAEANHIAATITDGKIEATDAINAAKVTIAKKANGSYSLKTTTGKYFGNTKDQNKLVNGTSDSYDNTITLNADGTVAIVSAGTHLRFNATEGSGNNRFRYYKAATYTNQKAIALYKYVEAAGGNDDQQGGTTPDPEPTTPTYSVVEAPVVDTAYKFGMVQGNLNKTLYINGKMDKYYMATTEDVNAAVDVKLETADGGYYLTAIIDGAKKYMNIVVSGTYTNVVFEDNASSVYTFDTAKMILVTNVNGSDRTFGTDNRYEYNTVSAVVTKYDNFFCKLYAAEATVNPDPKPEPDPVPTTPAEIVDAAYKLEAGAKLEGVTLTGKVTEIVSAYSAQYGNITVKMVIEGKEDKPINCKYMTVENATTVEVGDTITVEGDIENNFYNNVSTIQFYRPTLKNVVKPTTPDPTPDPDPTPSEPEADSKLTIKEAIALGETKDKDSYTTNKYYVTGKVVDIANVVYGNLYIADEEGNELFVYGVGAEDGSKFETLDPQPKVGDTITIYGVVGKYTDVQMKNTVLKELVAGQGGTTNTDPKPDSVLTVKEAIDLGLSKRHDIFTEGKYYVTGTIKEIYNEQYGNMRIVDEDGNVLTLYGTYAEDGTPFSEMAEKPAVGDEITIYGIIGQYNGTAQVKNGVFKAAPAVDDGNDDNKDEGNKDEGIVDDGNEDEGNKDDDNNGNINDAPNTGDANAIFFALLAIAAAGLVLVVSKKRV